MSWLVSRGLPVTGSFSRGESYAHQFDKSELTKSGAFLFFEGGNSLDLNFRIYGTMFKRSKTSALGASPAFVSDITATGFLNG